MMTINNFAVLRFKVDFQIGPLDSDDVGFVGLPVLTARYGLQCPPQVLGDSQDLVLLIYVG
jgi:hypothetical protein